VVAQGTVAVTGVNSFLDRNWQMLRYGAIGLIGLWLVLAMLRTLRRKGAAGA